MKVIVAYTDGSCNVKSKLGGFGAFLQFREGSNVLTESFLQNGYSHTTVSRMELLAIITTLQIITIKNKYKVIIISDSQYTVNSINNGWVFRWESEGFIERKNKDLWSKFLEEYRKFTPGIISFIHTRGHGKGLECYQKGNDIADALADYKQFKIYIKDEEKEI